MADKKISDLGITISYAYIFGISSAILELIIGHLYLSVYDGVSFIITPGNRGRLSQFIVLKLDKIYQYGSAPRFTSVDSASQCEKMTHMYIQNNVRFKDLQKSRKVFSMASLEENIFQIQHYGRVIYIGDSIHKVPLSSRKLHLLYSLLLMSQITPNLT